MAEAEVVKLATAINPQVAHIWRQALENEGIRCQVVGDYVDVGFGDMTGTEPEVWVLAADVERARAILQANEHSHADDKEEAEDSDEGQVE